MTHKYEIRLRADGYYLHKAGEDGHFPMVGNQWGPFQTLGKAEVAMKNESSGAVWKYVDDEEEIK